MRIIAWQALQDLQGVLVPQHLQTNRIAQAALAGRHRVQLSSAAAELLMRFLHSARLTLLLALVNEYLELAVSRSNRSKRAALCLSHGKYKQGLPSGAGSCSITQSCMIGCAMPRCIGPIRSCTCQHQHCRSG